MPIHLVQLKHPEQGRRVAVVEGDTLKLVREHSSIYELAQAAIHARKRIGEIVETNESLNYDDIYNNKSKWKLLAAFDHPGESARCFVTGTGLTHKASADNRQSMHGKADALTDSMKMYRIGLEGGRPDPGCVGASPEWFYKGVGSILRAHNEPLDVPPHGEDGGDEAEIAGVYLIGPDGAPYRVGLVQGNEFSDHLMEARNYLYLAQSKLRACSIGPELIVDPDFSDVRGTATVVRENKAIWQAPLASGEKHMCHSMANLEHHHFKHAEHRHPGDVHIHFFGADMFSFKDRLKLQDGDVMEIAFQKFGRPLRNPLRIHKTRNDLINVQPL
jgi:hypothetical protein